MMSHWLVPLLLLPAAEPAPVPAFGRDGVSFLQKHCLHCHGEKVKKAGLALHRYLDDAALLKDRKVWDNVRAMLRSGEMPPKPRPRPAVAEIETFLRLVAEVFTRADSTGKPDPGRVTVRRLNRFEYDNTIRDLVGVDSQASEDFPADDVGHGFDNIGDVLSVSPVLMERYLAAAENIVQRAVLVDLPKPPVRHLSARYLEPAIRNGPRWREVPSGGKLFMREHVSQDGDYLFRVRAHARPDDGPAPRVALVVDGKELRTVEVTATEKSPAVYEAPLELARGEHRSEVKLLGASEGPKARKVFVEWLELVGPKDTRPPSHKKIMACDSSRPPREQAREILTRFASRAYRRPATTAEVDRLLHLVDDAQARGDKWEAGVRLALQAVLVSPKFLFRLELDDRADGPDPRPLDDYHLASRLSYFLWGGMPDDELFGLAAKKSLAANVEPQVRRMLKGPRAKALVDGFAMQWLQLRRLKSYAPDPKLFPNFNERLRTAMLKETELFVDSVFREDHSVLDLIDADYTFLNDPLARHYGIADTNGNLIGQKPTRPEGRAIYSTTEFRRVSVGASGRGGLLTQASILTVTSNPTRTSPVKRGRWVLEQILGTPPPPPPPDVPELPESSKAVLSGSLRQRMEQHRANASCANCHARMDPIGFAFENFDAIGAFRSKDAGFAIDPSGTLPDGRTFKGPADLKAILKEKKDLFARNLTEKMLTYALGRGLEHYDRPAVDRIVAAMGRDNYKFSTLMVEIARSDPFRMRRGKEGPK